MKTTTATPWVTMDEARQRFGVSRRTFHRWIAIGCPVHQPGGPKTRLMFDLDEIDGWVRSRCSTETPAQESAA